MNSQDFSKSQRGSWANDSKVDVISGTSLSPSPVDSWDVDGGGADEDEDASGLSTSTVVVVLLFPLPVTGTEPPSADIRKLVPAMGRFFNQQDNQQRARVAVIGSEAKTKLFSGQFPVGESIRINGVSFQVIGVLEPKMQEGDDDINRQIYIPFNTTSDLTDT